MSARTYDFLFKIVLIGDQSVGKTCIIHRFCDQAFKCEYITTIGIDFKVTTINLNGKIVKLQIWDTAGQERFRTITKTFYRGAKGILLTYDITNRKSFDNVANWIRCIDECADDDVEKMLIGNKCDMKSERAVSMDEGAGMACDYNLKFLETSAKENINIRKTFTQLAQAIIEKREREPAEMSPPKGTINIRLGSIKTRIKRRCCL